MAPLGESATPGWGRCRCERPSLLASPCSDGGGSSAGIARVHCGSRLVRDPFPAPRPCRKDLGPCFLLAFPVASMETENKATGVWTDRRTDRRAGGANTPRSAAPRGTEGETEARDESGGPGRKATLAALGSHSENKSVTNSADPVLIAPAPRRVSTALPAARGAPPAPPAGWGLILPPQHREGTAKPPPHPPLLLSPSGELSLKTPKTGHPTLKHPILGIPAVPTCPRLPGAAEGPGGAGLGARRAPLAVRVAHEAALASTAVGWRGPRCYMAGPSGLRRGPGGPGTERLSAAGSHPSEPRGAERSQAAVPEPMVRAERRGLPGSPGGSRSTLPAPSLRRGCLGDSERLRGLKGDALVAKH